MSKSAYKKAGVDIEAGNNLVQLIKPAVKASHRSGVMGGLGGFGALFDPKAAGYKDPILVSATDGVGTKLKVAIDSGHHSTIGQDLVAMCVNDLVVQGAEPLFFLDYFACGMLDIDHAKTVISSIAEGCEMAGCALIGGETAEMPGMYASKDYDLAGFSVGAVERGHVIDGQNLADGDVIIGLPSSGLHSNGYSLVRKVLKDSGNDAYDAKLPFEADHDHHEFLYEALLAPTRIYSKSLSAVFRSCPSQIKALAHITGGGLLENIPRVLSKDLRADLDASTWKMHNIFKYLSRLSDLSLDDVALTFNCGIGMSIFCAKKDVQTVMNALESQGEAPVVIGVVRDSGAPVPTNADIREDQISISKASASWA